MTARSNQTHILTVAVEDYFQVGAFNQAVQLGQWHRFESRVERNTKKALDLLDRNEVKATFFALGWIADEFPEVIREIAQRGHEIASKGYWHRSIRQMTPGEFRDDLLRSKEALEKAAGKRVLGYRVADEWLNPQDLWALEILAQEGFAYDSSICPMWRNWAHEPWRRTVHRHRAGDREIWEVPLSTMSLWGWSLPIAGGNYYRQFPHRFMKAAFHRWNAVHQEPFVMYFQVWELDRDQPIISASSFLTRIRHYRNLGKMGWVLSDYFRQARFQPIAQHLGLSDELAAGRFEIVPPSRERIRAGFEVGGASESEAASRRTKVTLVVPCYNEELVLPYLANTLSEVERAYADRYQLHFVFVDDKSRDGTYAALERVFGSHPRSTIVGHSTNLGVAQAILTGIRAAQTEIVCSIDCDCTYDPHQIGAMIPLLTDGIDLVTASPYHREGRVVNVPEWRLFLSRTLSALYRCVFRTKLATYTSCFRVYRKSAWLDVPVRESGFLGVVEMLGVLDQRGRGIAECPAVLEVRMLGRSKMKLLRTIVGHIKLFARFASLRLRSWGGAADAYEKRPGEVRPLRSLPLPDPTMTKGKTHG
jgi:polysaccharide deacetylase family protein (PEP-CTERM system associated)